MKRAMAFGPDRTLPVGTMKQFAIDYIVRRIDQIIENTEGNEVHIPMERIDGLYTYRNEIIQIYLKAGWKSVQQIDKYGKTCDPHLILSSK